MSEPNRRPGALWTFAVLMMGSVLYVLSAGPLAWLIGRCGFPEYLLAPYEAIYKPLELIQERLPAEINGPYERYINWWLAPYLPPLPVPPATTPAPASVEEPLPTEESQ